MRLPWEHALCTFRRGHRHQPSVPCLGQHAPFFPVMAEPVLPPLPDPQPEDNQVAAEPAVPPAEAAEPGEENEVIASLLPCVLRPVFRFPCQRFRPLGCIVLFCSGWFHPCTFHCLVLVSLLGWRSFAPWLFPLTPGLCFRSFALLFTLLLRVVLCGCFNFGVRDIFLPH